MKRIDFKNVSALIDMVDAASVAVNYHLTRLNEYKEQDKHKLFLIRRLKNAAVQEHLLRAEVNLARAAQDKKLATHYKDAVYAAEAKINLAQAEMALARAAQAQREYEEADAKWLAA